MPRKPELKQVKRIPSRAPAEGEEVAQVRSAPAEDQRVKRIRKLTRPVAKLRVLEAFDSFYSGGEIQVVGADQVFFSIFSDKVRVYSLATYRVVFEVEHKNEEIHNFVTFEKNGSRFLITFTKNGMVRLLRLLPGDRPDPPFEVVTKKKVLRFLAVEMRVDSSGKYVIMADPKGDFKIMNAQTLKVVREFNLGSGYVKMRIVGQYIAFVSRERALVLYNILTNRKVRHATTDTATAFSDFAVLSTQKKQILLAGFDNKMHFFDAAVDKIVPVADVGGFVNIVETISLGNEKNKVLCILGFEDGAVRFYSFDVTDQRLEEVPTSASFKNRHAFHRILFDFPRSLIYFVTDEGEIFKTKLQFGTAGLQVELQEEFVGLNDQIMDVRFISRNFGVVCTNSETIRIISLADRRSKLLSGHEDIVTCVDVFKQKFMLTGCKDGRIHLWRIVSAAEEAEEAAKGTLEFGEGKASAFGVNFRLIKRYKAHTHGVTTVRFAPKTGTKFVSAGSEGIVKLWNLKDKTCKSVKPHAKELNFVRISDNEKLIVTGSHDRHINFYSAKDLSLLAQVPAHKRGVWDADFAPIEPMVASASSDQTIKLWNYENLPNVEQVGVLEGSTGPVLRVKWIVNGLQLISGSADGIVKIWNAKKKICVATFDMHEGRIWSMDVLENEEGNLLVWTGDNNNKLLLWEDVTAEQEAETLLAAQENTTALEHIGVLCRQNDYKAAVKFAFGRGLQATFFDTIGKWRAETLHRSEKVYDLEEEATAEEENKPADFEGPLGGVVWDVFQEDKKKLFLLLKNFVTHSRYAATVQVVLKVLLRRLKVAELTTLADEMRGAEVDVQQLMEVYQVFTERHFWALKRSLKAAHSFGLFIERHGEVIN